MQAIRFDQHSGYAPLDAVRQDHLYTEVPRPTEYLLPQIRKHILAEEFPYIVARKDQSAWNADALRDKVRELGPWEYYFEFAHDLTTRLTGTFDDGTILFHRYRSKLITETIIELLGNDLATTEVIDLACHCGAFSLDLAFRGAKQVVGIELRDKNLNQANFLREYYQIDNVSYRQADVTAAGAGYKADVVMCLGLLYHVVDPVGLLETCSRMATRMVVIDTITHKEPWPGFHLIRGKNPESTIEGSRPCEFHPTYRGVIALLEEAGFKSIVEVVGTCDQPVDLYSSQHRRCFIGIK